MAQSQLPSTDVWLIQLKHVTNGSYEYVSSKKITDNPGYDNQPSFAPTLNSLFYVSELNSDQTDIYQFNLLDGSSKKILSTDYYKEYSPMMSPDKSQIGCIRVEPDDSSQRFWTFPSSGGIGKVLFSDITDLGYYCWLGGDQVAFFRLGKENTLHIANTVTQSMTEVDNNIGRCMVKSRNSNKLFYVKKYDSLDWKIRIYDLEKKTVVGEIPLPEGAEDFTLGPNDEVWLSNKGKVWSASLENKTWKIVFDFSKQPFKDFYRIVFSPDLNMLAVVSYEGKKP
ncbi:MAG TPA: hypothetical protein DCQ93_00595 [Bacteroidetes bacterium]|nr:hypothetical protein [Bacteroidota bacterium]